jgi:ribonuclease J
VKKRTDLVFVPLGGVGEIGMNLGLYGCGPEHDRRWLMVDCGISFAGPEYPGVDIIVPDIHFIEEESRDLEAIIITHAHEDHIGALVDLWPRLKAPVYLSPFAADLLEARHISDGRSLPFKPNILKQDKKIETGRFTIHPVEVAHSIPESHGLFIKAAGYTLYHTGDWKLDPNPIIGNNTNLEKLSDIAGPEGVDILISDSTNAEREGTSFSEGEVGEELQKIFSEAPARVAITLFSSNVARIRSIMVAAQKTGRDVVVVGRALQRVTDVARENGYLKGLPGTVDIDNYGYLPRDKTVLILTGSQGEPRAALSRIAHDDHRVIDLNKDDWLIFSSRIIPGNEREVLGIMNALSAKGVKIITDKERPVHTSGHPRRDELRQLFKALRPKAVLPVHGEAIHMQAQLELAKSCGIEHGAIIKDGQVLNLDPDDFKIIDEARSGILVRDGNVIDVPEETGAIARRKLAYAGIAIVSIVLDAKGNIIDDPDIAMDGIPSQTADNEDMEDIIFDAALGALESIPKPRRKDNEKIKDALRRSVRAAVAGAWGKKPACSILVHRI